jgi:Putative restriction endonuclease
VAHTLLHEVLVSELVVPVLLAQKGSQRSQKHAGLRLAGGTLLCPDLMVFHEDQLDEHGHVHGAPLLVVEVLSPASRPRDLGRKKEAYARCGAQAYWLVDPRDSKVSIQVYELKDDRYVECAVVRPGESYWATQPLRMELAPDQIFDRTSRWDAPTRRNTMEHGPDLPSSEEPILLDAFGRRWPTGAEKVELEDGCPIFYGTWDERDVTIAERAYPGRVVRLDQPAGEPGTLTVLPGPEPPV